MDLEQSGSLPTVPHLAAGLAHNVNNALTGVISYLELALSEVLPGTALHEQLRKSLDCAEAVAGRVRTVVAFAAQPHRGAAADVVSLHQIAEESLQRAISARPGLSVTLTADETDGMVRVNVLTLHLVLEQLLENALEAMPDPGRLRLHVQTTGDCGCLSITDNGPGLCEEAHKHLFEPFFTTKPFGHLGLGLSLCREMLQDQGGEIQLTSATGQGTTVTLSLPSAQPAREDAALQEPKEGGAAYHPCRSKTAFTLPGLKV